MTAAPAVAGAGQAEEHLLLGTQLFKQERFAEALVEFKVAQKLGAAEAAWYSAASLVKLDRPEEAVESFAVALERAPEERDALLDYYRALALYGARLYLSADRVLLAIKDGAGPRIASQVEKIRGDIARAIGNQPAAAVIDWYLNQGSLAASRGSAALSTSYYEEAASLAARRQDGYRREQALKALGHRGKGSPSGAP